MTRRELLGAAALLAMGAGVRADSVTLGLVRRGSAAGPVAIEYLDRGQGPLVVMLPSLGRGASDFDDLAARVAGDGYRVLAVNPRGIGASAGPMDVGLWDLADDVLAVMAAADPGRPAVLVGHAYGNRWARAVATRQPDRVKQLVLLAAGGQVAMAPEVQKALYAVFDTSLSPEQHLEMVRTAFFAPGNDPAVWREGWYPLVAQAQGAALRQVPAAQWAAGGGVPMHIVQPERDAVAPVSNAEALRQQWPDRVTISTLPDAGHAMLPEQPDRLAALVLTALGKLKGK